MNRLFIIGNLSTDVEKHDTQNGKVVYTFTLAVNRRFAGANGDKVTDFFRISAWGKLGESCAKYLCKGRKASVIGEIQPRLYDAKNGQQRMSLDVQADEVEFLSPAETQPKTRKKENSDGYDKTAIDELTAFSGDLPF